MNKYHHLFNRATEEFFKILYKRSVSQVLNTPPLMRGNLPFTLLSMVHQRDVISYLVAIKSFSKYANPERVIIVCDPTIGDHERDIFHKHVPHVELRNAIEFRDPRIPQGGCWERLSAITVFSPESYIVQLDADTVTINQIPEVLDAINERKGFVLGEKSGQGLVTLEQAYQKARDWPPKHVQAIAEQRMVSAGLNDGRYVRGCAGFTGFPATSELRNRFFYFSEVMQKATGKWWSTWGSEQVASNYLIANIQGTNVLPFPKYGTPDCTNEEVAFLHFIGTLRFTSRMYEKVSSVQIREIKKNDFMRPHIKSY